MIESHESRAFTPFAASYCYKVASKVQPPFPQRKRRNSPSLWAREPVPDPRHHPSRLGLKLVKKLLRSAWCICIMGEEKPKVAANTTL